MINEQENKYISNVKAILSKSTDSVLMIEELVNLDLSGAGTANFSNNTTVILRTLFEITMPSFDDFLEGMGSEEEQTKACDKCTRLFEKAIEDLENNNLYIHKYSIELAYSKLVDQEYTYKLVRHQIEANTLEEAISLKTQLRNGAPKKHPEDETYTLEDDRLKSAIIDSKNNVVVYEQSVAIPGQ